MKKTLISIAATALVATGLLAAPAANDPLFSRASVTVSATRGSNPSVAPVVTFYRWKATNDTPAVDYTFAVVGGEYSTFLSIAPTNHAAMSNNVLVITNTVTSTNQTWFPNGIYTNYLIALTGATEVVRMPFYLHVTGYPPVTTTVRFVDVNGVTNVVVRQYGRVISWDVE